ncbi:MAG TPA: SH3 domain-containing protein [Pseudonocardia sp.]|nr:SH3 domain-containing protein [Pseudonocardia sp.]
MPKLRLSGRKAALAGVSIAAATAAVVAVAAPASAAPNRLTTCNDTVRVRSQPSESAPVIGSCRSGEQVTVDRTQNGFAHLVNKQGWASLDFLNLRRDLNSSYRSDDNDNNYNDNCDDNDRYRRNDRYNNNDDCYDDNYNYRRHDDNGLLGGLGN